jgi:hypothetical protein
MGIVTAVASDVAGLASASSPHESTGGPPTTSVWTRSGQRTDSPRLTRGMHVRRSVNESDVWNGDSAVDMSSKRVSQVSKGPLLEATTTTTTRSISPTNCEQWEFRRPRGAPRARSTPGRRSKLLPVREVAAALQARAASVYQLCSARRTAHVDRERDQHSDSSAPA